jgi:hypothetical protein
MGAGATNTHFLALTRLFLGLMNEFLGILNYR